MIKRYIILGIVIYAHWINAMDDEPEVTPAESRRNKVEFMSDTFTNSDAWELALSLPKTFFACTPAPQSYSVPQLPAPSGRIAHQLIDYCIDNKIPFSMPSLLFEEGNATCIACEDTSLHFLVTPEKSPLEHHYIPPCHNKRISGIAPLSNNWFALAGGSSITFCNLQDQTHNKRITFKNIQSIAGITNKSDILVVETSNKNQLELFPYSTELYALLHGNTLNEYQIEVVFKAALALHLDKKLTLEPDEQKIYAKLPPKLLSFVNAMRDAQSDE